jgi:endonuclease YncB( thermonuclease family)
MLLCEKRDTDRYGRDVAQCYVTDPGPDGKPVKGMDIGRAMVRAGHAMAYRTIDSIYAGDEPKRFEFEPPWEWRERHPR